ncbi:hypothetical protein WNZ14_05865 [Hoeflea sp. AS60]|uniref:hypothetical protein n=1 Tax=Hoeflea sp. AS60 TaxID=3135780 RepID=UPI00316C7C95
MPAGSSVSVGGFDGELNALEGNAFVPKDKSVWELSVEGNPKIKAERDYNKRTKRISEEIRTNTTYVAVTGRKWAKRGDWVTDKKSSGDWKDIRVIDADDIELWLEQETATQIWFAELLGLPTGSLKSPERYWSDWNRDVVPAISAEAILASREKECERLVKLLHERKDGGIIVIHADSVEEAVAFSCAAIIRSATQLSPKSVVVGDALAWTAVASSSNISLAIASETVISAAAPNRDGLILLVPVATGDSEAHFPGHRGLDIDPDLCLQRTLPENFRDALIDMGVDRGDAKRLALQCGRSWSVYRRVKNNNPAQKQPIWGDGKYAPVLTTLALVGAYAEGKEADQKAIEQIAEIPFDDFAGQAEKLIRTNDAPIVRIGSVVKAKSPLELFKMNEAGISAKMLGRFLRVCEKVIGQQDPAFDMAREDRWLANVEGKTRPESGALFRALADALPRIAYLSANDDCRYQIGQLVRRLTREVEGKRWLAISGVLRQLAEAAPDDFLHSLEVDLGSKNPQVFALFEETTSGGIGGDCVYADLLWALETLAWAPNRLLRVSKILAELTNAPKGGSWVNSPSSSLLNIFRGWRPQTSATIDMRNRAISALSKSHPKETFSLAMGMLHKGYDTASPSSRPNWREDDAGSKEYVTSTEYAESLKYASQISFELSGNSADNATDLFERYNIFDEADRKRVLETLKVALEHESVDGSRKIRKALRNKLHWELNYGGEKREGLLKEDISKIQKIYDESQPIDLIEKHQWLFENYYCELPEKEGHQSHKEAQEKIKALRVRALQEVFDVQGFSGIEALGDASGPHCCVGGILQDLEAQEDAVIEWAAEKFGGSGVPTFIGEWLQSFKDDYLESVLRKFLRLGSSKLGWTDAEVLEFLSTARCEPTTWTIVGEHSSDVQRRYWKGLSCLPLWHKPEAKKQGIEMLLQNDNPGAALRSLRHGEEEFDGSEIAHILEKNFASSNNALGDLQHHNIRVLVEVMEKSATLDRQRLLGLEFQMIAAFGQFVAELMTELQREIIQNPKEMLFTISKAYKADYGPEGELGEQETNWARACSHLLLYTKLTPGLQRDGTFSEVEFRKYVEELMKLARAEGYVKGAQIVLGELLAHSPEADNGDWPHQCVCEILDVPDHDAIRDTFRTGVYNKRGVSSRLSYDGGEQERELATKYQGHADGCQIEFPLASKTLADIADSYRRDALRHDRDAEFSKERF